MADYIDRQAAINTLCDNCDTVQAVCPHYPCKQYTSVEALPSADVQPVQHSRWNKIDGSGLATCGCGYITDRYSVFNYCPHCGARMGGEQNETD